MSRPQSEPGPVPARVGPAACATDAGQAAVETALVLPLLAVMALGIVQVGIVVAEQVAVVHAAREGARAAAVSADPGGDGIAAAMQATSLRPLEVDVASGGHTVTVTVSRASPTDVPIVGAFIGDVSLRASATMRWEP
jgi:Flp pilus assembly protein TadG